jgi:hypothetical protein
MKRPILLTRNETCKILRIGRKTLHDKYSDEIPPVIVEGRFFFREIDVSKFIGKRTSISGNING